MKLRRYSPMYSFKFSQFRNLIFAQSNQDFDVLQLKLFLSKIRWWTKNSMVKFRLLKPGKMDNLIFLLIQAAFYSSESFWSNSFKSKIQIINHFPSLPPTIFLLKLLPMYIGLSVCTVLATSLNSMVLEFWLSIFMSVL